MALNLGDIVVTLKAATTEFNKAMANSRDKLSELSTAAKSVSEAMKPVAVASTAAFATGSLAIGKLVDVASDAQEQMNVIGQGFGPLTDATVQWAETTADSVGRSRMQMLDFAGSLQAMLVPMTGSVDAAADMSTNLSQLAVDLGSFFNVADDDALAAIKSGLVGASEPMRKFGVVMTQASLQAFALSRGITTSVKDMDEAQKVALRYQFILDKTATAQGDAARTAGGFANLTKRLQGQLTDLAADIGSQLLPIAEQLLAQLSSLLGFFQNLSPEAKAFAAQALLVGTALAGAVAAASALAVGLASITTAVTTLLPLFAAIKAAALTAFFPVVAAVGAVVAAIGGVILIVGALKQAWEQNLFGMADFLRNFAQSASDLWSDLVGFFTESFQTFIDELKTGFAFVKALLGGATVDEAFGAARAALEPAAPTGGATVAAEFGVLDSLKFAVDDTVGVFEGLGDVFGEGIGVFKDLLGFAGDSGESLNKQGDQADIAGGKLGELGGGVDELAKGVGAVAEKFDNTLIPALAPIPEALGSFTQVVNQEAAMLEGIDISGGVVELKEKLEEFTNGVGEALKSAGDTLINATGEVGEVIQAGIEGFQTGGVIGALIAVIAEVLTRLESFTDMMDRGNERFFKLLESLNQLFEPIFGLIETLDSFIEPALKQLDIVFGIIGNLLDAILSPLSDFGEAITPLITVFAALDPALNILSTVVGFIAAVLETIAVGFAEIFNGVLEFVAGIVANFDLGAARDIRRQKLQVGNVGDIWEKFARDTEATWSAVNIAGDGAAKSLAKQAAMDSAGQMADQIAAAASEASRSFMDAGDTIDGAGDSIDEFGKAARDATASLLNVPTGFKIAAARFAATVADGGGLMGAGMGGPAAGAAMNGGRQVTFAAGSVVVRTDDPEKLWRGVMKVAEREQFTDTGGSVSSAGAFALPQTSGQNV